MMMMERMIGSPIPKIMNELEIILCVIFSVSLLVCVILRMLKKIMDYVGKFLIMNSVSLLYLC